MKSLSVAIEMKATEHYFSVVPYVYYAVLTCESVVEILKFDVYRFKWNLFSSSLFWCHSFFIVLQNKI